MVKPLLKLLVLLCLVSLICALAVTTVLAEELSAIEDVSDGGYYRLYSKAGEGCLTVGENALTLGAGDSAESIIEISETNDGAYTLHFISKERGGYIAENEAEAVLKDTGAHFSLSFGEGGLTLSLSDGRCLSYTEGKAEYSSEQVKASFWSLVECKPESMYASQSEISVKPYISYNDLKAVITPSYLSDYVEWESLDRKVVIIDNSGKFCSLAEGETTVMASFGTYSIECKVNVAYDNEYAWFSQNNVETGGWNGKSLYNIYFSGNGYRKRFAFNGSTKNNDWLSEGCAVCSIAQVLNNMGARLTEGYDIRSGLEGNLLADPYTVALANTDNYGAKSFSETLWGDPVLTRHNAIAQRFNYKGAAVRVAIKHTVTKKTIKEALDKCPWGVVVRFDNAAYGSHYITFNKCINPEADDWRDYQFLVSDPVAVTGDTADNVLFEQSYSYKRLYYRYTNATLMQVWDYQG